MTDEMDRLKRALDATRPEPDHEVRRRAMDAALRAFDQEKAREIMGAAQGSAAGDRQNGGRASLLARLFGHYSSTSREQETGGKVDIGNYVKPMRKIL